MFCTARADGRGTLGAAIGSRYADDDAAGDVLVGVVAGEDEDAGGDDGAVLGVGVGVGVGGVGMAERDGVGEADRDRLGDADAVGDVDECTDGDTYVLAD